MKRRTSLLLLILLGLALNACQPAPSTPPVSPAPPTSPAPAPTSAAGGPDVLASARGRQTSPAASGDDVHEAVAGNSAFALDLYRALRAKAGNLIYSPYSISQALAMTYGGARGNTEKQMAATLYFTLPQGRLHPALNALDLALMRPPELNEGEGTAFQLNIANSIWGQKSYSLLPDFLDLLAENYGAGLRLADFVGAPEPARLAINGWVSDQTKEKIKDLIPQGAIDPDTRLVLANAIYFKAGWQYPFEPSLTQDAKFNLLDGSQVSTPMMSAGEPLGLPYIKGANFQAAALSYKGGGVSMLIILPDAGHFGEFQDAFTAGVLGQIVDALAPKQVELVLPKFSFDSEASLAEPLAGLGMPDAFAPGAADFSGMDGTRDLLITAVLHKAFVGVDEEGTEAAAATAVIVGVTSIPVADVQLTVDRPFIFLIRDEATGSLLFVGQVLNPAG